MNHDNDFGDWPFDILIFDQQNKVTNYCVKGKCMFLCWN